MHFSAYQNLQYFYRKYCKNLNSKSTVLDFGSYDVNGTSKPIFEKHNYIGVDISDGPNVDLILENYKLDLPDNFADAIVSSSCFEHDELFWVTFNEICRLTKPNGYIYIMAPSEGGYHGYPVDCWRFYKDSWKALDKWSKMSEHPVELIESFIDTKDNLWKDSIGIFKKIEKRFYNPPLTKLTLI